MLKNAENRFVTPYRKMINAKAFSTVFQSVLKPENALKRPKALLEKS
jgi:hypothetical protein